MIIILFPTNVWQHLLIKFPFCLVIKDPKSIVCFDILNTRDMCRCNPDVSVHTTKPYISGDIITRDRVRSPHVPQVWYSSGIIRQNFNVAVMLLRA